jgi:predicted MFS family arabinose efflux permease
MVVAVVQFAIITGATMGMGGIVFDTFGPVTEFLASAVILVGASAVAFASGR